MIRNARIVDGRPMEEGNVFDDTLESLNVNFVVGTCLLEVYYGTFRSGQFRLLRTYLYYQVRIVHPIIPRGTDCGGGTKYHSTVNTCSEISADKRLRECCFNDSCFILTCQ